MAGENRSFAGNIPATGKRGKENRSYAGNVKKTGARTKKINGKLKEMVENMTHPHTCAEIAEYCLMSKQAVYQIEKSAMKKIAISYLMRLFSCFNFSLFSLCSFTKLGHITCSVMNVPAHLGTL